MEVEGEAGAAGAGAELEAILQRLSESQSQQRRKSKLRGLLRTRRACEMRIAEGFLEYSDKGTKPKRLPLVEVASVEVVWNELLGRADEVAWRLCMRDGPPPHAPTPPRPHARTPPRLHAAALPPRLPASPPPRRPAALQSPPACGQVASWTSRPRARACSRPGSRLRIPSPSPNPTPTPTPTRTPIPSRPGSRACATRPRACGGCKQRTPPGWRGRQKRTQETQARTTRGHRHRHHHSHGHRRRRRRHRRRRRRHRRRRRWRLRHQARHQAVGAAVLAAASRVGGSSRSSGAERAAAPARAVEPPTPHLLPWRRRRWRGRQRRGRQRRRRLVDKLTVVTPIPRI